MRILSFSRVLLLLFLSCFVAIVSPTVILTQNVTNTVEDSITVFPGITIQITCVITGSGFIQWIGDGGSSVINNGSQQAATLGDFSLMLLNINESSISSTATAVSSSNTSLTCSDNDGNIETIDIIIKPVDPQVYMIQNVTSNSSNITICPNDPITFSCRSTTGILVWELDDGQSISLTSFGEMKTLGDFELVVTNVTILSLEIESTATISSPVTNFTLSCHTNVTNGLNRLSSAIEVAVRSPPVPVSSVNVSEVCYESISLNWTDTINSIDTPQLDHYLVSVTAQNTQMDYIVNGFNTSLTGLTSNELYTLSVVSVNCAGSSNPVSFQRTIIRQKPSVPTLQGLDLLSDRSNASIATISVRWEPGVMTDCLQSPVTSHTIIVSGVIRTVYTVDGSVSNSTLTVPSCGASAVTVSAVNDVDSSDRSDSEIFRGTPLTLTVSTRAVDGDSVTLSVTITECLRSSVENVTVTYRNEPSFGYTRTVSYPNNSASVSITLSDLLSTTDYNATVVVYYKESERTSVLGPSFIMFATTEDLFSLREAVIIGLSVAFGVSVLIIVLIIALLIAFCYKLWDQYKSGITLRKKFKSLVLRQKEIEEELRELRERRKTMKSIRVPHERTDFQMRGPGREAIARTVEVSEM
ncbi:PREDICTED: uncharacterized protein LOC109583454 [Amphimedon queenslandica]|uniref:Fibronectin type-III domain-containing protein n=1 Tax=Amphimedon queenslandica TaxID=400682 RepID=A0AAN0JBI0_AMPQE|nr:PREDICTED: uncharacterized protein LOC109583454 [Amphimedon queenslandica]|eukprot:XP_019854370.1 PREDICTED: uncharacterized protein LOC109583454 [Amphimedon queenslandica]